MEAKFLGEFFKIAAGRIGNVGPYDILTEDWLRDSYVSEVIDKRQEAGVNLKEFGRLPHGTLL